MLEIDYDMSKSADKSEDEGTVDGREEERERGLYRM